MGKAVRRGELISDLDTLFREVFANNGEHFEVQPAPIGTAADSRSSPTPTP